MSWASEEQTHETRSRAWNMMLKAITKNPSALEFARDEVRGNRELVLTAIGENAAVLEFASQTLRFDQSFVLEAVARNPLAIWHAPRKLQANEGVILAALARQGAEVKLDHTAYPVMDYYLKVMREARKAVASIRKEARAAREEQERLHDRHVSILEAELDALAQEVEDLTLKQATLDEPRSKKPKEDPFTLTWEQDLLDAVDGKDDPSLAATNALHFQCLTTSALQAKVDELAALALANGAPNDAVDKITTRPIAVVKDVKDKAFLIHD